MDERTRLLVSLGAAVAANCVPCFENFFRKTEAVGLTAEEIREAADIGDQVKNGARIAIRSSIRGMIEPGAPPATSKADGPCCPSCE